MALSITEANAVNHLYRWLTADNPDYLAPVDERHARDAMAALARGASRALSAGVRESDVQSTKRWPALARLAAQAQAWEAIEEILASIAADKGHASAAELVAAGFREQERLAHEQPPAAASATPGSGEGRRAPRVR